MNSGRQGRRKLQREREGERDGEEVVERGGME